MMFRILVVFALLSFTAGKPVFCDDALNPRGCCPHTASTGIASHDRTPNDRYGRIAQGGPTAGWTDLPNSVFHRFHDYLELWVSTTIPQYMVLPRRLEWGCLDKVIDNFGVIHNIRSCIALVFIYRCKPCDSLGQNAMIGELVANNWQPVHCAGYFDLDQNVPSHDHRFSMFFQEFVPTADSSTTLGLDINQDTEFMFWGQIHKDSTMCAHQLDEPSCDAHSAADDCYWDDQTLTCKPVMCPRNHNPYALGPGYPQCSICVHPNEDGFLPH